MLTRLKLRSRLNLVLFSMISLLTAAQAHAWGKHGHSIVCQTAAYLAAGEPKGEFLKSHAFDLGYYCNVPDLVWKAPATYKAEWTNHFMDMEIFEREMKDSKIEKPFELDREGFNAAFPKIADEAGRAWWRIRELSTNLDGTVENLRNSELPKADHQKLQLDWLVVAGVMGHYVGDLGQPLHVSENYDGQLSGQKGVHAFYEDTVVDELFLLDGKGLENEVMKEAKAKWPKFRKDAEKKTLQTILMDLTQSSSKALPEVLKIDKKIGRKDLKKAAAAYRASITSRMAASALVQAEIYRRHLGWDYNGERFYSFATAPAFIAPGHTTATAATPAPTATPSPAL